MAGSLVAQMVKTLPAVWKTPVRSLGREDRLEKGMATHSSILAWRIPWTEEAGGLSSTGSQRVRHDGATSTTTLRWKMGPVGSSEVPEPRSQNVEFEMPLRHPLKMSNSLNRIGSLDTNSWCTVSDF